MPPRSPYALQSLLARASASLAVLALSAWSACALAFQAPGGAAGRDLGAALAGAVGLLAVAPLWRRRPAWAVLAPWALALCALLAWWQTLAPSDARDWADDVALTATGRVEGAELVFDHVRNFEWHRDGSYTPHWESRRYGLDRLASVDLLLSHWSRPAIAHTLVSFGFDDGRFLAMSVEIRRERQEDFSRLGGFFKAYEMALVAADERDIVRVRTNLRNEDAYLYRVALPPAQRRALLLSYLDEANALARQPRWYHTLTANCTTIVVHMVRLLLPRLPLDYRLVLSGYLPDFLHDVGALEDQDLPMAALRSRARITDRARAAGDAAGFSLAIRQGLAAPAPAGALPVQGP